MLGHHSRVLEHDDLILGCHFGVPLTPDLGTGLPTTFLKPIAFGLSCPLASFVFEPYVWLSLLVTFLTFLSPILPPLDALIWNVMLVANVHFKAWKHTMISMVVSALFRLKTGRILVILAPFDSFGSEFSLFWVLKSLIETHFDYGGVLQLTCFNFCTILASLSVNVQKLLVFGLPWAWNFLLPSWEQLGLDC